MKNYTYKILAFSSLLLMASCNEDELIVSPNDGPSIENYYKTNGDFRAGVDYAYDAFKGTGYYAQANDFSQTIIPDIITDNLIISPDGRNSNQLVYNFEYAENVGGVTNLYGSAYAVVARANAVLTNTNKLPAGVFKNNIEAEAKAIRALAHFDIVTRYAKIPTQSSDANESMGIAYVENYDPFFLHTRDLSVAQVYAKIIADLTFAEQNIQTASGTSDAVVGRFNKAAIQGLLSRVYLFMGDYTNSVLWGERSLALSGSVGTAANFKNIWNDTSNDGVLFKVLNSAVENIKIGSAYNQTISGQIRSEYVPDYDFFTKFQSADIRKDSYFLTSPLGTRTYNNVIKYRQATGKPIEAVDVKLVRTAEVVLNVAESKFKLGDQAGALTMLNRLRAQRYTPYTAGTETGTSLWDAIMLERRKELAFEMDRYFTLKRLALPVERSNFGPYSNGTGNPVLPASKSLPASSFKWQWPIPLTARQVNPGIKPNPGYN